MADKFDIELEWCKAQDDYHDAIESDYGDEVAEFTSQGFDVVLPISETGQPIPSLPACVTCFVGMAEAAIAWMVKEGKPCIHIPADSNRPIVIY